MPSGRIWVRSSDFSSRYWVRSAGLAAKRVSGVEFRPWRMEFVEDVVLPSVVLGPEDFCALSWFARIRAAVAMVFGVLCFEIVEGAVRPPRITA